MNAHQRRVYKRLCERVFGNHVDYYVQIPVGKAMHIYPDILIVPIDMLPTAISLVEAVKRKP